MKVKRGIDYILFYIFWLATLGLGAWFVIISREAFETYLGKYYIKNPDQFIIIRQARVWDIVVSVGLWLLWFVMMIVTEEYYRKGAEKHIIWQRFAKVAGVLLVLIFIANLCQNLMLGLAIVGWLPWLLGGLELIAGIALIYVSRSKPAPKDTIPGADALR